jgi:AcrR family transcriptional regulator
MAQGKQRRGPGRPPAERGADVRRALIDAARKRVIAVGFDAASTKSIASEAGVNPAMISYYFGGKAALCDAMMRDTIAPLAAHLENLRDAAAPAAGIAVFMRAYMHMLAAHPDLPQLIVREVLPVSGRFRRLFVEELAGRAGGLLPVAIEHARSGGEVRSDADAKLTALALVSLAAFPFLAAPIVGAALAIDVTSPAQVDRLVTHAVDVFVRGVGVQS